MVLWQPIWLILLALRGTWPRSLVVL
jgi:hypothetical protein